NAVLDVMLADGFLDHVRKAGLKLTQKLARLRDEHSGIIEEVRGLGLMTGLKCKVPNRDLIGALADERMLSVPAGDNVVRLMPPLIVSDEEIDDAVRRLDRACLRLEKEKEGPEND
ncbi:MAG TPA: aminotransferase class III-fold pyridoxal phosphate-dependent enzyme, partial [Rhizobiales bacterium]|nr:aminotransferase class III-fold pyridoxal phosphate-dependent enzyme [Hyphomicrobiales bacterium]